MDANQIPKKKLFICKFCNKKYPCGKSLGGHIRIHLNGHGIGNNNSTDAEDSKRDSDSEAAGQYAGYGLRENPKKTRRFVVDSNQRNKLCKECGKGFPSLKALCGHMASHSKTSFEDQSETSEKLKDHVFDTQSDTETSSAPSKRRRSTRRNRYKSFNVYSSLPNSDVSDEFEHEQEEVAMCLMMLSKDSGFKGCFAASVADFSDDNSVYVEAKAKSSPKLRISVKNGVNCVYNANGNLEPKKSKVVASNGNAHFENSDSGYFRYSSKKIEPESSVDDELKKQKLGYGLSKIRSRYDESETASRKRGKNNDSYYNTESPKQKALKTGKFHRTNGYESDENSIETERAPNRKKIQSLNGKSPIEQPKLGLKKGKVHECPFCYKVFRSGQALGGHKRSHFVGGGEDRTLVIDHQVPEVSMSGIIDLNLPAPMEDDSNGYYLASW